MPRHIGPKTMERDSEPDATRGGGRMSVATIVKPKRDLRIAPNLLDYEAVPAAELWQRARQELDGLPGGAGLNIAHEAVDRHALGARADHLALRWLGRRGGRRDFTYAELGRETSRFANALAGLGLGKGDLVAALAGRIPELYIGALGTLKNRSVFSPLFSAFGPEPIRSRLAMGHAKARVTTESLYARK